MLSCLAISAKFRLSQAESGTVELSKTKSTQPRSTSSWETMYSLFGTPYFPAAQPKDAFGVNSDVATITSSLLLVPYPTHNCFFTVHNTWLQDKLLHKVFCELTPLPTSTVKSVHAPLSSYHSFGIAPLEAHMSVGRSASAPQFDHSPK